MVLVSGVSSCKKNQIKNTLSRDGLILKTSSEQQNNTQKKKEKQKKIVPLVLSFTITLIACSTDILYTTQETKSALLSGEESPGLVTRQYGSPSSVSVQESDFV